MSRLILSALLLLLASPALARDWYISDCLNSPGGSPDGCWDNSTLASCVDAGSLSNPFCPDPDNDGDNDLVA